MNELKEIIRDKALELGFEDVGYCSVAPFEHWYEKAYEPIRSRLARDPKALMADAQCIIVAVRRYAAFGPWPDSSAMVANYYVNSTVGFEQTKSLAACLADRGFAALPSPQLPAKQAALRAGLGVQGMNTQFCHDGLGMLVSLHLILTNAPISAQDSPRQECSKCGLCAAACPTGAVYDGGFAHENCLRFHMADGSVMPVQFRDKMGLRLIGCTDCQHACPHAHVKLEAVPAELAWACDIASLLSGDPARYEKLAELIGTNFARPKRIRAQAAICAGNSGNSGYVPQLSSLLLENSAVLRCHAAWALGKLGGPEALGALQNALATEQDEKVSLEIKDAMDKLS